MSTPTERELGYIDGIKAVRSLLSTFDQSLPGFDRQTCQKLYAATINMQEAAIKRIYAIGPRDE